MKRNKVIKNVMERVVKYEKNHTYHSIEIWLTMLLGFISLLILLVIDIADQMAETGATDLMSMMVDDWELAGEYWSVLWETISYELPWFKITESVVLLFVVGIISSVLIRRVEQAKRQWSQMKKYFDDMEK